mmetsp:Transcript_12102/g.18454  ORF Transcript_12102/g.18454 Transcript_12102/m.18454 type:complete len:103 (-) Transcript_12102:758-1066(-)
MLTSPVRIPLVKYTRSKVASPVFRSTKYRFTNIAVTPAAAAETVVLTAHNAETEPGKEPEKLLIAGPMVKPYHPNHSKKVPKTWSAIECPLKEGDSRGAPSP